ncbi:MAG: MFS transporter [Candidatus Aminicenantaceae bacterium]
MSQPKTKYRWVILFMVYICMLVFAFTLQFLPPILPTLIVNFNLSHAQAGLLMSLFTLPAIFLAILAGLLSDRWGTYKVGLISLLIVIAGTLTFALSRTFVLAGIGRTIAGAGAVTLTIVAAKILSQWFHGREVGSAMGIYNTAMPVGSIICFSTFGKLAAQSGWRMPVFITAAVSLLGLTTFLILFRSAPDLSQREAQSKQDGRTIFSNVLHIAGLIWMAALCWLLFNAAVISFSTFAPDFFVSKGKTIGYAGFLTSLLMWGSLVLSPVIGRLIDKFNSNGIFIGVGGSMLAVSLVFVSRATSFIPPMAVMAVAVAFVPTPVFSYLSKNLPPKDLGVGFGILGMVSGIGMFFGPTLSGLIRDKTGSYEMTFLFLAALSLLITAAAVIFQIRAKKAKEAAEV